MYPHSILGPYLDFSIWQTSKLKLRFVKSWWKISPMLHITAIKVALLMLVMKSTNQMQKLFSTTNYSWFWPKVLELPPAEYCPKPACKTNSLLSSSLDEDNAKKESMYWQHNIKFSQSTSSFTSVLKTNLSPPLQYLCVWCVHASVCGVE